jgi:hypothetical protein
VVKFLALQVVAKFMHTYFVNKHPILDWLISMSFNENSSELPQSQFQYDFIVPFSTSIELT